MGPCALQAGLPTGVVYTSSAVTSGNVCTSTDLHTIEADIHYSIAVYSGYVGLHGCGCLHQVLVVCGLMPPTYPNTVQLLTAPVPLTSCDMEYMEVWRGYVYWNGISVFARIDGCAVLCVVTLHVESCFSPVTGQALCHVCVVCREWIPALFTYWTNAEVQ